MVENSYLRGYRSGGRRLLLLLLAQNSVVLLRQLVHAFICQPLHRQLPPIGHAPAEQHLQPKACLSAIQRLSPVICQQTEVGDGMQSLHCSSPTSERRALTWLDDALAPA